MADLMASGRATAAATGPKLADDKQIAVAANQLVRLPLKLAAHALGSRLAVSDRAALALSCRHGHAIACGSVEALVLWEPFGGSGSGSRISSGSCCGSGRSSPWRCSSAGPGSLPCSWAGVSGSSGGASTSSGESCSSGAGDSEEVPPPPEFAACTSLVLRPRTMFSLSRMVAGALLPAGGLRLRLPALEEVAIEVHDAAVAKCDLALHVTSVALQAPRLTRLRLDQPGMFTASEAAAVARMPALRSLVLICTQGLEPGALTTLAAGASGMAGLAGRLRHLHIELAADDSPVGAFAVGALSPPPAAVTTAKAATAAPAAGGLPWVTGPLSPVVVVGSQSGAPPRLSVEDETALRGFAPALETLALIGLAPQLCGTNEPLWEPLLMAAADECSEAELAAAFATTVGPLSIEPAAVAAAVMGPTAGARLSRLELRGCGSVSAVALNAAAEIRGLARVDVSGSAVLPEDAALLAHAGGLQGLGIAPLRASCSLLAALAEGCPRLVHLSVGGLGAASRPGGCATAPGAITSSREGGGGTAIEGGEAVGEGEDECAELLPARLRSVSELQLLGCSPCGPQPLALAGLALMPVAFPQLLSVEIVGAWTTNAAAVADLCGHLARCPQLRRLRLQGVPGCPMPSAAVLPALWGSPSVRTLELLCVVGIDDVWMAEAVAGATKAGMRCTFREVEDLALGAPPPAGPATQQGALPSAAAPAAAGAVPRQQPASTFLDAPPGQLSDRGLVRLFGCMRLRRLALHYLPSITLSGVKALTRGVPTLECISAAGCPALSVLPRDVLAREGMIGTRCVDIVAT